MVAKANPTHLFPKKSFIFFIFIFERRRRGVADVTIQSFDAFPRDGSDQIVHREHAALAAQELGRDHGAKRERATVLYRVAYLQHVVFRSVGHRVVARGHAHAIGANADERGIVGSLVHPSALAVHALDDVVGERRGRAARRVLLLSVVRLLDAHFVLRKTVHESCQFAVETKHEIHSQRIIRGVEHRSAALSAQLLQFGQPLGPPRGAAHHRRAALQTFADVAVRRGGGGELYGHVGAHQILGREVRDIVLIDDERHLVAAFGENALYLAAHLAVTYYNRFHNFRVFCKSCKDSDFIILSNKIARAGGMGCAIFAKFNTFVSIYINFLFT